MNRKTLRVFTFGMVLCSVGVVLVSATARTDSALVEIAQYREWTRLNDKPIVVHSFMTHV